MSVTFAFALCAQWHYLTSVLDENFTLGLCMSSCRESSVIIYSWAPTLEDFEETKVTFFAIDSYLIFCVHLAHQK